MATFTKVSQFNGKSYTMIIPEMSQEEFDKQLLKRDSGTLIQQAFPTLHRAAREFIISGWTPQQWADMFGGENTCDYEFIENKG